MPLWLFLIAVLVLLELASDFSAVTFATSGQRIYSIVAVGFAVLANLTFQAALRNGAGLARGGTLFGVSVALGSVLLGVVMFKEHLTAIQIAGVVLGIGAIVCLS